MVEGASPTGIPLNSVEAYEYFGPSMPGEYIIEVLVLKYSLDVDAFKKLAETDYGDKYNEVLKEWLDEHTITQSTLTGIFPDPWGEVTSE